jgi:hypothetical protein
MKFLSDIISYVDPIVVVVVVVVSVDEDDVAIVTSFDEALFK